MGTPTATTQSSLGVSVTEGLDRDEALTAYRMMLTIRRFEEAVYSLLGQGKIRGTSHLCIGQEAVAVGACMGLRPMDQVTSNHRGHGHFLAKGGDPCRIMAELFGKSTGYASGRGGTQHMACYEIGFLGSNGITGGGIPIATGAALAAQMRRTDRVVLCFFGEGATAQGACHEAMNIGALWQLPIVYLCENNLYAMSTPVRQVCPIEHIADRAAAYAMPGIVVDGSNVAAVKAAVAEAAGRARTGGGPTLIEAKTYRFFGHSKSDTCQYRTREEEAAHRVRDPLTLTEADLRARSWADEEALAAIGAEVAQVIEGAIRFAEGSPEPDEEPTAGVFAEDA